MGVASEPAAGPAREEPVKLRRLLPVGEPATALQIADELEAAAARQPPPTRPYVIVNMISTADGRASIGGRSGPLGGPADHELFHALRTVVDAVMVGAGTVRAERYGRIIREEWRRRLRRERGRDEEALACVVSGRMALPADLPLLADPLARVAIITASQASLTGAGAQLEYVRAERHGLLDLPRALAELHERFEVRSLLCEGGPHLNAHLLAAGLVDELLLTLSPKLAGGDPMSGESLRIIAGPELDAPVALQLRAVLEHGSQLFLRYGVCA